MYAERWKFQLKERNLQCDYFVKLASLSEEHDKVVSRLSQLQEDVDKLRSLSDTLSSNYDQSTSEVCYMSCNSQG